MLIVYLHFAEIRTDVSDIRTTHLRIARSGFEIYGLWKNCCCRRYRRVLRLLLGGDESWFRLLGLSFLEGYERSSDIGVIRKLSENDSLLANWVFVRRGGLSLRRRPSHPRGVLILRHGGSQWVRERERDWIEYRKCIRDGKCKRSAIFLCVCVGLGIFFFFRSMALFFCNAFETFLGIFDLPKKFLGLRRFSSPIYLAAVFSLFTLLVFYIIINIHSI